MSDTELEKLYQNLDLTFAMQQIADCLEELGDTPRALAWRYIASKQFAPAKRGRFYHWTVAVDSPKTAPHRLPYFLRIYSLVVTWRDFLRHNGIIESYTSLVDFILEACQYERSVGCMYKEDITALEPIIRHYGVCIRDLEYVKLHFANRRTL